MKFGSCDLCGKEGYISVVKDHPIHGDFTWCHVCSNHDTPTTQAFVIHTQGGTVEGEGVRFNDAQVVVKWENDVVQSFDTQAKFLEYIGQEQLRVSWL